MDWQDEGIVVAMRKHGETSAIIEVLTSAHGRHAGVVRGGVSRKMMPVLQPGNQVAVTWRARLEEHLGSYQVELLTSRSGVMSRRDALAGMNAVCAMISFCFPERMDLPALYGPSEALFDAILADENWQQDYVRWEMQLLEDLGFGLELHSCAVTDSTDDLCYVSPKSGRAVSRSGAGDWANRLFPLPAFLGEPDLTAGASDIADGLRLTGYFLQTRMAVALGARGLPAARERFVEMMLRKG